jgi:hypothetical protein
MKQNDFTVEVVRTTKIEVDDKSHGLPPHRGCYKEFMVSEYFCPDEWSNDGVFIPVEEGDPLWFDLRANEECACVPAIQRINPLTGEPANLESGLSKEPLQNYMRLPEQKWIDGYVKEGKVYQFRVTKAGVGLAVNEFVLPLHMQDSHAIGFAFFDLKNPKPKVTYRDLPDYYSGAIGGDHYFHHSLLPDYYANDIQWVNYAGGGPTAGAIGALGDTQWLSQNSIMRSMSATPSKAKTRVNQKLAKSAICCSTAPPIGDAVVCDSFETTCESTLQSMDARGFSEERREEVDLTSLEKASMGAGGRIVQDIYQDTNSVDFYKPERSALLTIYFALPDMFKAIMDKGKRQDASRPDKYKTSGHIAGIAVPLMVD